jgi:pheromone shutdown protein TraB
MNWFGYNSDVLYLEKDNHKIVLIGTVHLSPDREYYKNISTLNEIYKLEDYKLYYEMVKDNPNASQDTHKTKQALSDTFSFLSSKAKLKQQHDYLYYNVEDKNADIDFLELEKLGGIKEIKKFTGFNELLKTTNTNNQENKESALNSIFETTLMYYFRASIVGGLHFNDLTNINKNNLKVILEERNKVLVNTIDYEKNAVVNYGNAHLSGIIELLEKKGYKVVAEHKLKAF